MKISGEGEETNFKNWTVRGLGEISTNDGGTYNKKTGAGSGSDYIYSKYTKKDKKQYDKVTKRMYDDVEVSTNLPQIDMSKVNKFLAFWKNETGTIGDTTYKSDGKKVKYKDIYSTKTAVGDLFESAPEMFFELLEEHDSTKELADIFRYIMYKYTGINYGITDESQIAFMFDVNSGGTSAIWHDDITRDEFIAQVNSYNVPSGSGSYGTFQWGYDTYFKPNAGNFYDIATGYGLDPRFIFSIGIHESGYGTSNIANEKGNFFGWGANDSNPYGGANTFYDMSSGIDAVCKGLANNYVSPNGTWYQYIIDGGFEPSSVEGIGYRYASDPNWANCVKGYMLSIFNYSPSISNGDFLEIAKSCHDYIRQNNFFYSSAANKNAGTYVGDGISTGNGSIPYPNGTQYTDCSAYVTWVLYEYGYTELTSQRSSRWFMDTGTMQGMGWRVLPATEAQAGDIVAKSGHVEIYAGDGNFYNAGSTSAIRREISNSGTAYLSSFTYAIRVTPPSTQ